MKYRPLRSQVLVKVKEVECTGTGRLQLVGMKVICGEVLAIGPEVKNIQVGNIVKWHHQIMPTVVDYIDQTSAMEESAIIGVIEEFGEGYNV